MHCSILKILISINSRDGELSLTEDTIPLTDYQEKKEKYFPLLCCLGQKDSIQQGYLACKMEI